MRERRKQNTMTTTSISLHLPPPNQSSTNAPFIEMDGKCAYSVTNPETRVVGFLLNQQQKPRSRFQWPPAVENNDESPSLKDCVLKELNTVKSAHLLVIWALRDIPTVLEQMKSFSVLCSEGKKLLVPQEQQPKTTSTVVEKKGKRVIDGRRPPVLQRLWVLELPDTDQKWTDETLHFTRVRLEESSSNSEVLYTLYPMLGMQHFSEEMDALRRSMEDINIRFDNMKKELQKSIPALKNL